jgi:hypothetical protein
MRTELVTAATGYSSNITVLQKEEEVKIGNA